MSARIPLVPTVIVLAAVAIMMALGIWQLGRADEKAEMLARYAQAGETQQEVAFPISGDGEDVWFSRSTLDCSRVLTSEPVAGTAANGAKGWAMRVTCADASSDAGVIVDLGFSRELELPRWEGGQVTGIIAPGPRLVADPPEAGLYPLAEPDPRDLPNNHMAYAFQWFFFALTALAIYAFALRSRIAKRD